MRFVNLAEHSDQTLIRESNATRCSQGQFSRGWTTNTKTTRAERATTA